MSCNFTAARPKCHCHARQQITPDVGGFAACSVLPLAGQLGRGIAAALQAGRVVAAAGIQAAAPAVGGSHPQHRPDESAGAPQSRPSA